MNRNARVRNVAVVVGTAALLGAGTVLGAGAASAATAAPSPGGRGDVRYGDVDGDHAADRLTLERGAGGVWAVRADLAAGGTSTSPLSDDPRIADAGLTLTDVNSDGVDEVLAPTALGANTTTFALIAHRAGAGLVRVVANDGTPLTIYEGGGVAAVAGYECPADHDGRTLDVVETTLQDGSQDRYEGSRTTYALADGVATAVHVTDVRDARYDDPVLVTDPDTCAAAH